MCIINSSEGKCIRGISSKDSGNTVVSGESDVQVDLADVLVFNAISSSTIIVPIANMVPASKNCKAHTGTWWHI